MTAEPVLRPLPHDELDSEQRMLYEAILGARTDMHKLAALTDDDGALLGPFDPLLRSPVLGQAVQQLGLALRHTVDLPRKVAETAILTVAVHHDAEFEWYAHSAIVRNDELLDAADLKALREGREPADEQAALAWRMATAVLAADRLSDELIGQVREQWGDRGLVELVCTVGHYTHLAMLLRSLGIDAPE